MSTKETGGSAFPSKRRVQRAGYETNEFEPVAGMTLRDYFAAKAMQAWLVGVAYAPRIEACAAKSYEIADAMLEARK